MKEKRLRKTLNRRRLNTAQIRALRKAVYRHFALHGRNLPWRKTSSPYNILVSEIMLQQTQVDRVVEKYRGFIRRFPTFASLARASTKEVIGQWQGLGFNRRAIMLQRCAQKVHSEYAGRLPQNPAILQTLPGIGAATAASIAAYAFNQDVVFIETNIRTVFLHHFFRRKTAVSDHELLPLVAQALDRKAPSRWYNALMDYGAMLKKKHANPSRRSAHHAVQSRFEGSDRQVRGKIIKLLLQNNSISINRLATRLAIDKARCMRICSGLVCEGFLEKKKSGYSLHK
jgi:A/G-specific adenine glycosylase